MRALAQKWKRLSARGAYLVYEEQYFDLCQWLGVDYWSKRHRLYNCLWCGETKQRHWAKGLCLRCYRVYVKQLERKGLPVDNDDLLMIVGKQLPEEADRIAKQLKRDRALPRFTVSRLSGSLCLI
jgi:hypothetical protein